jgi:hypothetical protein
MTISCHVPCGHSSNQTPEMPEFDGAFVDLPGIHINVRSVGGTKREYVRNDGTVLATTSTRWRRNLLYPNPRITVEGVAFEERLLGKRRNNHMRTPREVVNLDTQERVLRIDGMNFNGKANAVIRLSEARWYSFPVEGTREKSPSMTAVDQTGKQVALWRSSSDPARIGIAEIAIPPEDITTELIVMIATATPFFAFYFLKPGD